MKEIKNFLVTGTPRSSTTWFCHTLNSHGRIWMPEFTNYEPFNPHNIHQTADKFKVSLFDQLGFMDTIVNYASQKDIDYLGIKTFISYHNDISSFIRQYNFSIFVLIRKDIWKVLGSLCVAVDNKDFLGSSKRFQPYMFENNHRENRRLITIFDRICLNYWYAENYFAKHENFIEKVYMEDIIKGKSSYLRINNFFNQHINLSNDYDDDDADVYFKNFDEIKKFFIDYCKSAPHHYSSLPDYVKQNLSL